MADFDAETLDDILHSILLPRFYSEAIKQLSDWMKKAESNTIAKEKMILLMTNVVSTAVSRDEYDDWDVMHNIDKISGLVFFWFYPQLTNKELLSITGLLEDLLDHMVLKNKQRSLGYYCRLILHNLIVFGGIPNAESAKYLADWDKMYVIWRANKFAWPQVMQFLEKSSAVGSWTPDGLTKTITDHSKHHYIDHQSVFVSFLVDSNNVLLWSETDLFSRNFDSFVDLVGLVMPEILINRIDVNDGILKNGFFDLNVGTRCLDDTALNSRYSDRFYFEAGGQIYGFKVFERGSGVETLSVASLVNIFIGIMNEERRIYKLNGEGFGDGNLLFFCAIPKYFHVLISTYGIPAELPVFSC